MRNSHLAYIIAGILAVPAAGLADDETKAGRSTTTSTDHSMHQKSSDSAAMKNVTADDFAKKAAVISQAEIELGQLAMEKSASDDVKKFAKRMVTDHTASSAKLKAAATKDSIALPTSLDAEHKATKQKLSSLQGESFDREYVKAMAQGHDKAVALFESASQSAQVPADLKQFASSSLPTLREHQKMAHSLHDKGDDRTASD
jgi:putative membrane protein